MNTYLVTAATENIFESCLVPFLASAKSNALWKHNILVMDYGLNETQVKAINGIGVEVIKGANKRDLVNDRFVTLAEFSKKNEGIYIQYDADIYFCRPIDELIDNVHDGKILCGHDPWVCGFLYDCKGEGITNDYVQAVVDSVTKQLRLRNVYIPEDGRKILQVGFVAGTSAMWQYFAYELESLIESGVCRDCWGADTLALNYMFSENPQFFEILQPTYNCVVEFGVEKYKGGVYYKRDLVHAVHFTGNNRGNPEKQYLAFKSLYPEIHDYWFDKLVKGSDNKRSDYTSDKSTRKASQNPVIDKELETRRKMQCLNRTDKSSCSIINKDLNWHHGMPLQNCNICYELGSRTKEAEKYRAEYKSEIVSRIIDNVVKGSDYPDEVLETILCEHMDVTKSETFLLEYGLRLGRSTALKIAKRLDNIKENSTEVELTVFEQGI